MKSYIIHTESFAFESVKDSIYKLGHKIEFEFPVARMLIVTGSDAGDLMALDNLPGVLDIAEQDVIEALAR